MVVGSHAGRAAAVALGVLLSGAEGARAQTCPLAPRTAGPHRILAGSDAGSPVLFTSGIAVNLDGAPNAYHRGNPGGGPDPGLLHICNGVDVLERRGHNTLANRYPDFAVPGSSARCKADYIALRDRGFPPYADGLCLRVYGVAATPRACGFGRGNDCGLPTPQRDADGRETGFWVSTTSWRDPSRRPDDQAAYLDARFVPHLVLPGGEGGEIARDFGIRHGDVALLAWRGRAAFAVFADAGPRAKLGEASPAALNRLRGLPDTDRPRTAALAIAPGTPATTVLFPGSRQRLGDAFPPDAALIHRAGQDAPTASGGLDRLRGCPGLGGGGALAFAER